jgi:hypothetical protein
MWGLRDVIDLISSVSSEGKREFIQGRYMDLSIISSSSHHHLITVSPIKQSIPGTKLSEHGLTMFEPPSPKILHQNDLIFQ